MSRVLVVEDESAIAELIALNLRHAGFEVELAGDAEAAMRSANRVLPELALVDWMLPGMSGLQLVMRWRGEARTRALPLIMLTARGDETDKIAGLDAGADDYLTKPFSTKEMLARVRAVLRRRAPHTLDNVVELGGLILDPATRRVTHHCPRGPAEVRLQAAEFKLLHYLMTHPDRVYSRSQLLDNVWGDHVFIEERTVDVHIKRLREALAESDCASYVQTIRGAGYRLSAILDTEQPSGAT